MKIVKKKSTENCHFYSREKSLYLARACFLNVLDLVTHLAISYIVFVRDIQKPTIASREPRCGKTGFRCFLPCPTQTGLYSHRRWLEAWKFGLRSKRNCTICVAKTKALISFAVTAKLICVFVFAYAKSRFSHDAAYISKAYIRLSSSDVMVQLSYAFMKVDKMRIRMSLALEAREVFLALHIGCNLL